MKITVAMRVIGGFTIASLLLILIGGWSLINFNSIETATSKVSYKAIPTLTASTKLETAFLNMSLISTEAYFSASLEELDEKAKDFGRYKTTFDQVIAKLKTVLADDTEMMSTVNTVETAYTKYNGEVNRMYNALRQQLILSETLTDEISFIEDNADDASTYLLDFADLDQVQNDSTLGQAAEVGGKLESTLLSLITVITEYTETRSVVRAETLGNEVRVVMEQANSQLTEMQRLVADKDTSGTLDEITDLVSDVIADTNANDGVLQIHLNYLQQGAAAGKELTASEGTISQGMELLDRLLEEANESAKESQQEVSSSVSAGSTSIIVLAIVSVILSAAIGFFTVKAITQPLRRVNNMLQVLASGDLTRRLDDSSNDEFGTLARNCNNLIDSLKGLITGISSRATQLAATAEQSSTVTSQTTTSIQEQKSQIGQVATATTEMHSTSQTVTSSAEATLNQIRHADSEAEKVKAFSMENKQTIEVLAADVEQAAQVINKLHQDSASIGGILDVIRGVADQTNLLALNAAIEAARAGEHGRGFAVVADEVRTLASRTQQSTQEINAMIEVLQAGAEKAVAVMNQGKEQTDVCVEQTEKSVQALDLITDAVHAAHDVSSQIEQAAREQNLVSQEISEKLESIVHIAEETATGAQQTSDSSRDVAKLAEELQGSIQQFRV